MDSAGTLYTTEDYYHVIRTVKGASLPNIPTPPPKVAAPKIGIVTYVYDPSTLQNIATFNAIPDGATTNLYNDSIIMIWGASGAETYYNSTNSYPVSTLADPTTSSQGVGVDYVDLLPETQIKWTSLFAPHPHLFIKAMSAEPAPRKVTLLRRGLIL